MEESEEILLKSLGNSGVEIPAAVVSIKDLTPSTLFSISAQSLRLIHHSFPTTSLPDSMPDRFKICTELSSSFKALGYTNITFHKFLYPSQEDMYKLVRFLVRMLSESSEAAKSSAKKSTPYQALINEQKIETLPRDYIPNISNDSAVNARSVSISELSSSPQETERGAEIYNSGSRDSSKGDLADMENEKSITINIEDSSNNSLVSQHVNHISELDHNVISQSEDSFEVKLEIEKLRCEEKVIEEEASTNLSEIQNLGEEHELLKAAVNMAFDDQHTAEFYITQLTQQVDARRCNLMDLESHGDALAKALEDKRSSLEKDLYSTKPEIHEKLQKLKQIELERQYVLSEIKKREEELSRLSLDVEKQPKLAPRRSYIQRINEITKNSRKQEIDIERILKETRELQLESNSIQERLHRTYAVVDETVFREAKKDPVGQQAYRLLVSIHENFEQMSEKILATDRTQREVAEFEAKLSAMASRSLNIDKLQSDLDAIRKENEYLEQLLHKT